MGSPPWGSVSSSGPGAVAAPPVAGVEVTCKDGVRPRAGAPSGSAHSGARTWSRCLSWSLWIKGGKRQENTVQTPSCRVGLAVALPSVFRNNSALASPAPGHQAAAEGRGPSSRDTGGHCSLDHRWLCRSCPPRAWLLAEAPAAVKAHPHAHGFLLSGGFVAGPGPWREGAHTSRLSLEPQHPGVPPPRVHVSLDTAWAVQPGSCAGSSAGLGLTQAARAARAGGEVGS